jgi:hypothetical protein
MHVLLMYAVCMHVQKLYTCNCSQLAPFTIRPMDNLPHGQLAPGQFLPMDNSPYRQLAPRTTLPIKFCAINIYSILETIGTMTENIW